ncbi:MAG: xanthine dehydrogenase family protein subunit M, partial [Bacteroidota bacterium]
GFFETALAPGEIITEVRIPVAGGNVSAGYFKFAQPASRFALAGCAVAFGLENGRISQARVAFTGVSENAFRDGAAEAALNGQMPSPEVFEKAAAQAAENVSVLSDNFASEEYRRHLAKVCARRALSSLAAR